MTFRKGNKSGRKWGENTTLCKTPSTDSLKEMADSYLERMTKGQLEPGEQGTAAVVIGDRIRRLENTVQAHLQDVKFWKGRAGE